MPGHCKPILYGHLEASQPHLPALKKTKTEEGVTDLQNKFVIKLEKLYNKSTTPSFNHFGCQGKWKKTLWD